MMLLLLLLIFVSLIVETCSRSCCYFRCLLLQSVRSWGIGKAVLVATMFSKTLKVATGFAVALGGLLISSDECEESAWRAQRAARARTREFSLSLSLRRRAAATGDETTPLWAASPGAGREFTTYSETHTSTLFAYIVVKQKRERERQNTSQTDSIVTFPFSLLPLQITCTALHFHCRLRTPNFVFTAAPFKYTITRAHALSPPVLTITRQNENHVDINLRYLDQAG